jgi:site-specific recombinase XerD
LLPIAIRFRLFLRFAQERLKKQPSQLLLQDVDAALISAFLNQVEEARSSSTRTRNLRLTAIRSFFRYAAFEAPEHAFLIQRVLAIPSKKYSRSIVNFLTREEIEALLAAPDQQTWAGRRDHALILLAVQTGLRLSELTALRNSDVAIGTGAHIRVVGKGRKERSVPLTKKTVAVLKAWVKESTGVTNDHILFPSARGARLSSDGVQYLVSKHAATATESCQTLKGKRITPHTLRHSTAMELLQAGVDQSMIALWLGHESMEATQIYLHASLELKEKILVKTMMPEGRPGLFKPDDQLLAFLQEL